MPNNDIIDKDRLYLTLNHRHEKIGYHWALLLAPKDFPESKSTNKDSTRWDVTNELNAIDAWEFRETQVNQFLSISLCARILLAKFDPQRRDSIIASLGEKLRSIQIREGDPGFTCRVWVLNAVKALEDDGVIRLKISGDELEAQVRMFGDGCMQKIQSGKLDIAAKGQSAIPILDLRRK